VSPEHGRGGLQRDVSDHWDKDGQGDDEGQRDSAVGFEPLKFGGNESLDVLRYLLHYIPCRLRIVDNLQVAIVLLYLTVSKNR